MEPVHCDENDDEDGPTRSSHHIGYGEGELPAVLGAQLCMDWTSLNGSDGDSSPSLVGEVLD